MDHLTRRGMIGFGVLSGAALVARADDKGVIVADGKPVLFKIKDVTLDRVDRPGRTIAATFGGREKPLKMTDLPLGKDIRIRVSYVFPGVVNNVPFDWDRLEGLVGKKVSMMLRLEEGGITVDSVATQND